MCDACDLRKSKAIDSHYSVEDFEDEPRYRKVPRRSKYCKKSKTKEPCEFTVMIVKWSYTTSDGITREHGTYACHRCGKHGRWWFRN